MRRKIVVVGESCIDRYTYGAVHRLAPERPVPVFGVQFSNSTPGMAGNVHRNLEHLGQDSHLFTNSNYGQIIKERFVDSTSNHMFLRVDSGPDVTRSSLEEFSFDADLVIVSDYDKGFLHESDIEQICELNPIVFLDTKKKLDKWALRAAFVKINDHEYDRSKCFIDKELSSRTIKTIGPGGAQFNGVTYPVESKSVIDVSGAGDSFMAGLATEFLKSGDIVAAIAFANELASRVVGIRGMTLP